MKRMIKPDKQSLFSNPALFLNPLNWRVITDIICKSGIDTPCSLKSN
jgi:hypothetical protein